MEMKKETREVRYLSNDRNEENPHELVIQFGNDGDWYISVVPAGKRGFYDAVRINTSGGGGASMAVPGLGPAIASAFRALADAHGPGITHKT